ncbi:MAG TPA: autotransporter [Solirubrobacteraceae bacterium]
MMSQLQQPVSRARAMARICIALTLIAASSCAPSDAAPRAAIARSEHLAVVAHLHYVTARGSYLFEEGQASGALAGTVSARVRITAEISGSFTFYSRGGSVRGFGSAKLNESGSYASFGGTLKVLGGTGRYAHAHGSGRLYGVYNRRSPRLELTIQTTGNLSY